MEIESEDHLPFLDIDIDRRPDGSLGHRVYGKPIHTNLYLNARPHHHPSSKQTALSTLVHRARALCDQESLRAELEFLKDIFRRNGYNDRQIHRALNRHPNYNQHDDRRDTVAFLPFVGTIFSRIIRVLSRHNIKAVGLPPSKNIKIRIYNTITLPVVLYGCEDWIDLAQERDQWRALVKTLMNLRVP
ncbi:hypothetical protein B7P43_G14990 [Cryptotermes secundus]|uniref:Helix-turn-helix domain-containing protein n=1 Tax=Cryptotermes secundus TaxID=105785 RepID=A0A2J7RJA6_9NEOP|nr:hypothetical protein B7P43_G14990 [Cryptotermes secundus]